MGTTSQNSIKRSVLCKKTNAMMSSYRPVSRGLTAIETWFPQRLFDLREYSPSTRLCYPSHKQYTETLQNRQFSILGRFGKTSYKDPSITMSINEGPPDERALFTAPDISRGSVILSECSPIPFAISEISNGVSKFE